MAVVKILFPGYSSGDADGRSCSNILLVSDAGHNIIVDPGTLPDQNILVEKLRAENLTPADIDIVYLTHSHLDHFRSIGLFPEAKVLDFWGWWQTDVCLDYEGQVTADIEMIKTPGHSADGTTLLVKTADGLIAICGDVFWQENFPNPDPLAVDLQVLEKSRQTVLALADWVIPGHGPMFKSEKPGY